MAEQKEAKAPEMTSGSREMQKESTKETRPQARQDPPKQVEVRKNQSDAGVVKHRSGTPSQYGWGSFARLRDDFDRLFDQFSRGWLGFPPTAWNNGWGFDVQEDDDRVLVRAEAPGFEAGDFDIQVRGNQLVMCACRGSEERDEGYRGWQRSEFHESITLPVAVDAEKVKAGYRNGMLTITLPKTEAAKARRIAVES